jgi:transcriptional regulator with XRE-family HTH domain
MPIMKLNKLKIDRELERLGWSYAEMARRGDMSKQLLNHYLHAPPTVKIVVRIGKILNLDPKDLLI